MSSTEGFLPFNNALCFPSTGTDATTWRRGPRSPRAAGPVTAPGVPGPFGPGDGTAAPKCPYPAPHVAQPIEVELHGELDASGCVTPHVRGLGRDENGNVRILHPGRSLGLGDYIGPPTIGHPAATGLTNQLLYGLCWK